MSSMLFVVISVMLSLVTVFSLNWMLKWNFNHEDGITSYVLAFFISLLIAVFGLIGKQPLDWKTKLFLFRWTTILIAAIYLIIWLVNEFVIGPMIYLTREDMPYHLVTI